MTFGTYPQTAAGTDNTPIEWMVLTYDAANQRALLLSRYGLDAKPYNAQSEVVSWETCSLRAWLNGDFIKRAFSAEQQAAILLTEVDNSNGQGYVIWKRGSNSTQDRVFLLSYEEAYKYFGVTNYSGEKKARAAATQYALRTGISYYGNYKTHDGSSACTSRQTKDKCSSGVLQRRVGQLKRKQGRYRCSACVMAGSYSGYFLNRDGPFHPIRKICGSK